MKKQTLLFGLILLLANINNLKAQTNWEPQTKITGYVSTEFNYFDKLDGYNLNYGVALSEAGILTSYKPTENITFKAVFVYRPDFSFNQMLNEANVQYTVSDNISLKAGRFLTPLSPMNSYYYAPVNTSATLPMIISNHEFFPLNMDAVSVNGTIGNDFKFNYDLFAGGYRNTSWMKTGAVGFFGDEVSYYKTLTQSRNTVDPSYNNTYNVAMGSHIGFAYKEYITLGFSAFKPKDELMPVGISLLENEAFPGAPAMYIVKNFLAEKLAYGINFQVKYNNTKVIGEIWKSDLVIDNGAVELQGSFVELSHAFSKLTPFVRYEDQVSDDIDYNRYTLGMMYKPVFETTFKLEYLQYQHKISNINGLVASFIYSF